MTDEESEQARLGDVLGDDQTRREVPDAGESDAGGPPTPEVCADVTRDPAGPDEAVAGAGDGAAGPGAGVRETVELGVALLAHLENGELPLAAAVDRIETVTTDPTLTREILDTAEMRGLIDREDGLVRPRSGAFVRFDRDVVRREGAFTCRRCGASLSTGHFIRFDTGEHGPFGSSCIRKVTGRE